MKCNEEGLNLIRKFEGLRLKAYRCPAGILSVGYGHTGKDVQPNSVITEETAEVLLRQDVENAERSVYRLVYVPLNQNQFSALTSFVFNLGEGKLRGSRTISLLNARRPGGRNYLDFADAMLQWDKATVNGEKVVLAGLTKRRQAEKALFLKPVLI